MSTVIRQRRHLKSTVGARGLFAAVLACREMKRLSEDSEDAYILVYRNFSSFTAAPSIFIAAIAHIKVLMKSVDLKSKISYRLATRLNFFLQSLIQATANTRAYAKLHHARNHFLAVAAPALVSFQIHGNPNAVSASHAAPAVHHAVSPLRR